MPAQRPLFRLHSPDLEELLRRGNPWWQGERLYGLPALRRWAFAAVMRGLTDGMAPITVLRGPRQIGKTTLLNQAIDALLAQGVDARRILRVQFDDLPVLRRLKQPVLDLAWWFSDHVLGKSFHRAAAEGQPALLFLDEVQNLADWGVQLKHLVDQHPVRVLVTGSSALRIESARDSLAGRITTLEMGPLHLREIAGLRGLGELAPYLPPNGLAPLKDKAFWLGLRQHGMEHTALRQRAFALFSQRGAYPMAHAHAGAPWEQVADQLNETVVRRAIQHDLRLGEKGKKRDEHLLEEVFRLACRYIGQAPSPALYLDEIRRALDADIGWQRVLTYLRFLDGALLVRLIEPLELRLKRRRGPSKLVLCDHALRAAWLQEQVPLHPEALDSAPHLSDLAGHVAESVVGYFFKSIVHLDVAHFPERGAEPEVDFVLTVGEQRIPVEVKYRRRIDYADTRGLRAFIEKSVYNAPFGVLVTLLDEPGSDDPRIVSLPLSSLLLMR
ncbi:MAG: AAA family ATPase [Thiobacillaceae bacterium]|nr:AAA family ATPase [Thiobacillaceae bacterium]MDW8322914.1 AAA family ATPase [Burkholderiales bacterium]